MFSRTLPGFSCRLNAWATAATCQWLMGPCEVNDCKTDSQEQAPGHGVLIERYGLLLFSYMQPVCTAWRAAA